MGYRMMYDPIGMAAWAEDDKNCPRPTPWFYEKPAVDAPAVNSPMSQFRAMHLPLDAHISPLVVYTDPQALELRKRNDAMGFRYGPSVHRVTYGDVAMLETVLEMSFFSNDSIFNAYQHHETALVAEMGKLSPVRLAALRNLCAAFTVNVDDLPSDLSEQSAYEGSLAVIHMPEPVANAIIAAMYPYVWDTPCLSVAKRVDGRVWRRYGISPQLGLQFMQHSAIMA